MSLNKEQRKAILKELGYSKEEMKRFWNDCVELGVPVIKVLSNSGFTWKDLNEHQLRQLPEMKEKWLNKQIHVENKQIHVDMGPGLSDSNYQVTQELSFEEKLYNKICSGEKLSARELESMVFEMNSVDEIEGDDLRWTRCVETIVELCGHYYSISWQRALTENQEHEFWDQPVEVEPMEFVIKKTEWVSIKNKATTKSSKYIEVPCDIGDTIYILSSISEQGYYEGVVDDFRITSKGTEMSVWIPSLTVKVGVSAECIGNRAFFELSDIEKAVEEYKQNNSLIETVKDNDELDEVEY